jgi:hypothetical protein
VIRSASNAPANPLTIRLAGGRAAIEFFLLDTRRYEIIYPVRPAVQGASVRPRKFFEAWEFFG